MHITSKLQFLLAYYNSTRCVGHTKAAADALRANPDAIAVVEDVLHVLALMPSARPKGPKYVTLAQMPENLMGYRAPLVWDNTALQRIFHDSLAHIAEVERKRDHFESCMEIRGTTIEHMRSTIDTQDRIIAGAKNSIAIQDRTIATLEHLHQMQTTGFAGFVHWAECTWAAWFPKKSAA